MKNGEHASQEDHQDSENEENNSSTKEDSPVSREIPFCLEREEGQCSTDNGSDSHSKQYSSLAVEEI